MSRHASRLLGSDGLTHVRWQGARDGLIVPVMRGQRHLAKQPFLHRFGHVVTWLAVASLLMQMLGGASFLARLVARGDDPIRILAMEYLCTGSGPASTGQDDQHRSDDRMSVVCTHCLLCSVGFLPFLLAAAPLAFVLRLGLIQVAPRLRVLFATQFRRTAHPSRAPPLPA